MSGNVEVNYAVDFRVGKSRDRQPNDSKATGIPIPRIARLMALAIRFEGLVRQGSVRDYAELARRGHITRARMTQIMKLLDLAPDIQEQILFLPPMPCLNERNLRCIVSEFDWESSRFVPVLRAAGFILAAFSFYGLANAAMWSDECVDPRRVDTHATGNEIPSPSHPRDGGLVVRQLAGVLVGRLVQTSAVLSRDAGEDPSRFQSSNHHRLS